MVAGVGFGAATLCLGGRFTEDNGATQANSVITNGCFRVLVAHSFAHTSGGSQMSPPEEGFGETWFPIETLRAATLFAEMALELQLVPW